MTTNLLASLSQARDAEIGKLRHRQRGGVTGPREPAGGDTDRGGVQALASLPETQTEGGGSGRQAIAPQPSSLPEEEHELDHEISEAADGDALAGLEAGSEVGQLEFQLHTNPATNEPYITPSEKPEPADG